LSPDAPPLVLLVDDEILIQDLLAEALADAGYRVRAVQNGEAALRFLEGPEAPRAMVTDINLGRGASGWEVARRGRERAANLAVVYVSGGNPQDWASLGVPGSTMITKPFAPGQIVTAVCALLNAAET